MEMPFAVHLLPDLVGAVDLHVGLPDALDLGTKVSSRWTRCAAQLGIALMGGVAPIA
jgi:uncharacterized protein (DUF2237 family)